MRRLLRRATFQPRLALYLESLEDRRLLSGLLPLGLGNTLHSSSPLSLTDVVAAPVSLLAPVTTTVQHLDSAVAPGNVSPAGGSGSGLAAMPLLSPITTTVQDLGATVLDSLAPGVASSAPTSGPSGGLGLNLNLNVDVLFVHLDQVQLNVGVSPLESTQPLVSLGLGGTVALGGQTGGLLNLDLSKADVSVAPVGSSQPLVSLGLGSSVALGGQSGELLNVGPTVSLDLGGPTVASLGVGASDGSPSAPNVPVGVSTSSGDALTGGAAPGVAGSILGDLGGATQTNAPTGQQATEGTGTPAVPTNGNIVTPPNGTDSSATTSAIALSGASSSTGAATVLAAPSQALLDGGAGSTPIADAPLHTAPPVDSGGAGDPVVTPAVPQADGGGGEVRPAAADLAPEGSGLATRFQPDGKGRLPQVIAAMGAVPQGGWLSAMLSRLAPYLAALVAAGVGFDLERRRRLRRAAKAAGPRP